MSVGSGPSSERDADAHQVFMRLADASLPTSYRLAAHLLGDTSEAEDATQEALLLAWRGWPRLRDPERFGAWFDRILQTLGWVAASGPSSCSWRQPRSR